MEGQNSRGERSPQEARWELGIPLRVSWLLKNGDTDAVDEQSCAPHRKGRLHGQWVLCLGWHHRNAQFWRVRSVTNSEAKVLAEERPQ